MTVHIKARQILRRIIPWALESNSSRPEHRSNYKGNRGRIGIVGGARDYAGAPYFASISAMRLGADLAYVICSQSASQSIKNYSPDLIVTPILDLADENQFDAEIDCLMSRLHALVIGPGLGREELMQNRARKLIRLAKANSLPLVLDADSLLLVTDDLYLIKSYSNVLLTPNRIELQRLLDSLYAPKTFELRKMNVQEIRELVRQCSKDLDVTILAKGGVDIISSGNGNPSSTYIELLTDELLGSNRRCGGQGDILAGIAGAYLHWIQQANKAQEEDSQIDHPVAWAGYLAALTTRMCNELAFKEFRNGMLASHMIEKIHVALDTLIEEGKQANMHQELNIKNASYKFSMTPDEISRYTRQMIMEEYGPERQIKLRESSAIIVGAGGLGCPAAVYLGAGGIGRLGIVDDDKVEVSNLHRQILHDTKKVGMYKTESIKKSIRDINPNVEVVTHSVRLTRENAVSLFENYDIVIDASDNLLTRYLISDACVVAKKPLVSGAALKMDGQLTVYNYDEESPCFRCLFPEPLPPGAVGSCSDNGVLGVIPGVIGVQQALEALKIAAGIRPAYAGKMLLFDGQLGIFRHVTLGKRKSDCAACGKESKLTRNLIDYEEFCGLNSCQQQSTKSSSVLDDNERITVEQYRKILESDEPHVLIDVRPLAHSEVSRFAHALTIPVMKLMQDTERSLNIILSELETRNTKIIYVICKRGIASQRGTRIIQDLLEGREKEAIVKDIIGGMTAWGKDVDPNYCCL